ncbi:hypothetical protein GCM10025867_03960 [Frondihabitans sucicola]|uniref:DUF4229 domain-containing protein n=1 Tax=Frondihabitans sucicola TaxID=1268041 RepID=A0ABM8GIE7_9MICO|nr:hypothetical protein GCM10025867_03960 [Frondihabitans sucicola]
MRVARLVLRRTSRALGAVSARLTLFSGWTWIAAGSLIGFEMLEIVFSSFLLVPELLPVVLLVLAGVFFFRARIVSMRARLTIRIRAARASRHVAAERRRDGQAS